MSSLNALARYGISRNVIMALTGNFVYCMKLCPCYYDHYISDLKIDIQLLRKYTVADLVQLKIEGLTYCYAASVKRAVKHYTFQMLYDNDATQKLSCRSTEPYESDERTNIIRSIKTVSSVEETTKAVISPIQNVCKEHTSTNLIGHNEHCIDFMKNSATSTVYIQPHRLMLTVANISKEVFIYMLKILHH